MGCCTAPDMAEIVHDIWLLRAVYAVGLYVDPHAAKKLLDGKVSAGASALDQGVFDGRAS